MSAGHAVNANPKSGFVIDNALVSLVLGDELSPKLRDALRPLCRILRDILERNKSAGRHKRRVRLEVLPYPFARRVPMNEEKIECTTVQQRRNALPCGFAVRVAVHQQSYALRAYRECPAYERKWRPH